MPQLRKNIKFFANGKNRPLVDLSTLVQDGEEVISVDTIENPVEYNTRLGLMRDKFPNTKEVMNFDTRYQKRYVVYNRITLEYSLGLTFDKVGTVFQIDPESVFEHPLSTSEFINIINTKFGYDATEDDIVVTNTGDNGYTVTSKPNSLCFTGVVSVEVGKDGEGPGPDKNPSHDALWSNTTLNTNVNAFINNVSVNLNSPSAVYNSGFAIKQWSNPPTLWMINIALVDAVAGVTTVSPANKSQFNINETLEVTGNLATAKFIPFIINTTPPEINNLIEVEDKKITFTVAINHPQTLDRLLTIWIDDVVYSFSTIMNGQHPQFVINNQGNGVYTLEQSDNAKRSVVIRGSVPTLPSLINSSFRLVSGITLNGLQIPFDETGRELYCFDFPETIDIQPKDSIFQPVVVTDSVEFNTAIAKVAPSLGLTYQQYVASTPTLSLNQSSNLYTLTANTNVETYPTRYPSFYLISQEDWQVIASQPTNTVLGYWNKVNGGSNIENITVGYLATNSVEVSNGRLVTFLSDLPAHLNHVFSLDFDPTGPYYRTTLTNVRLDINQSRASLITPVELNQTVLRKFYSGLSEQQFATLLTEQNSIGRVITNTDGEYTIEYKFEPINQGSTARILQLMMIPKDGFDHIASVAATSPNTTIIIQSLDGVNTTMTARNIVQNGQSDNNGNGYLLFQHDKSKPASQTLIYTTDYDAAGFDYRQTITKVNLKNEIQDLPLQPFFAELDEYQSKTNYDNAISVYGTTSDWLAWENQTTLISIPESNTHSQTGLLTRYGNDTGSSLARVIVTSSQASWLRTSTSLKLTDVICQYTDGTEQYKITVQQIRDTLVGEAFAFKVPAFSEDKVQQLSFNFNWYGFGNPGRTPYTTTPNFENGSCELTLTCDVVEPTSRLSLFDFVEVSNETYGTLLNLLNVVPADFATPSSLTREVLTENSSGDVLNQKLTYRYNFDDKASTKVLKVIQIERNVFDRLNNVSDKSKIIYQGTIGQSTINVTIQDIINFSVVEVESAFCPVIMTINKPGLTDPSLQSTEVWLSDYSSINVRDELFEPLTDNITVHVFDDTVIPTEFDVVGPNNEFDWVALLAAQQNLNTNTIISKDRMNLTMNSTGLFGEWKYDRKDYTKLGYFGLKFKGIYAAVIKALPESLTDKVVKVSITSAPADIVLDQAFEFTRNDLIEICDLNNVSEDQDFYLIIPLISAEGLGSKSITTTVDFDGTAVKFSETTKNTVITIVDTTPADIDVLISGVVPATNSDLQAWKTELSISNDLTLNLYSTTATDVLHLTRNVSPLAATFNAPFAIGVSNDLRDYLISEGVDKDAVIGTWNGANITAKQITEGYQYSNNTLLFFTHIPNPATLKYEQKISLNFVGVLQKEVTLVLDEKPVVADTVVDIEGILSDFGQVITNLTTELNPIVNDLIPLSAITLQVDEGTDEIVFTVNGIPRDYINKKLAIPIGLTKTQLQIPKPTTSVVGTVKAVSGTTTNDSGNSTLTINSFNNRFAEGWKYTDDQENEYWIEPIIITLTDSDEVITKVYDLDLTVGTGSVAGYFNKVAKKVSIVYSVKEAVVSYADVIIPDSTLLAQIIPSNQTLSQYVDMANITFTNGKIGSTDVKIGSEIAKSNDGKLIPAFRVLDVDQINSLPSMPTSTKVGTIVLRKFDKTNTQTSVENFDLTYGELSLGRDVGGKRYYPLSQVYNGIKGTRFTITFTLDLDGAGEVWLPKTVSTGAIFSRVKWDVTGQLLIKQPEDQDEYDKVLAFVGSLQYVPFKDERWVLDTTTNPINLGRRKTPTTNGVYNGLLQLEVTGELLQALTQGYFESDEDLFFLRYAEGTSLRFTGNFLSHSAKYYNSENVLIKATYPLAAINVVLNSGPQDFIVEQFNEQLQNLTHKETRVQWYDLNPDPVVQPISTEEFESYNPNLVGDVAAYGTEYTVAKESNEDSFEVYNIVEFERTAIGKTLLLGVAINSSYVEAIALTNTPNRVVGSSKVRNVITNEVVETDITESTFIQAKSKGYFNGTKIIPVVVPGILKDQDDRYEVTITVDGAVKAYKLKLGPKAKPIDISCDGAETDTQPFTLNGTFNAELDGVKLFEDNTDIMSIVTALREHNLKVVIFNEISCAGALNTVEGLELSGNFGLEVEGQLIGTFNANDGTLSTELTKAGFWVVES